MSENLDAKPIDAKARREDYPCGTEWDAPPKATEPYEMVEHETPPPRAFAVERRALLQLEEDP
jgi:hypothetical protein